MRELRFYVMDISGNSMHSSCFVTDDNEVSQGVYSTIHPYVDGDAVKSADFVMIAVVTAPIV